MGREDGSEERRPEHAGRVAGVAAGANVCPHQPRLLASSMKTGTWIYHH
jgi:hypothetical protein